MLGKIKVKIYTKTHKIALYFMFIYRENALKSHQYISYSSIQRDHFENTIFLIQNLIKIFTKTHQIAHIFSKFSRMVACSLACVQLISLFLYEKNHFFIQNAIKIYPKTHQL